MSNTQKRIVSALVLMALVGSAIYMGPMYCYWLVFIVGIIVIDELVTNFLGQNRFSIHGVMSYVLYIVPFLAMGFDGFITEFPQDNKILQLAVILNIFALGYLFVYPMESKKLVSTTKKFPALLTGLYFLPFATLAMLFEVPQWRMLLGLLIIVNFGMDSFAWFWGKNFGRHKLWPSVSPKKTIEGFVGGGLSAALIGIGYLYLFDKELSIELFIAFFILACASQLGDLVQSKLKRQFEIKDSSSLIPGHGGVYDRIDSLLFTSPFYVLLLNFYVF